MNDVFFFSFLSSGGGIAGRGVMYFILVSYNNEGITLLAVKQATSKRRTINYSPNLPV